MNLRTEKEDLIYELNRANKLAEEATLDYMNMCKQVEVLEKCLNAIKEICNHPLCPVRCEFADIILQKIKEVKGNE